MAKVEHSPHPRIKEREAAGPHLIQHELAGLNGRIAVLITNAVGTMWCAYVFAAIALISLPQAIAGGVAPLIAWIAQTFLQLVLLSVIMVGQKVSATALWISSVSLLFSWIRRCTSSWIFSSASASL